LENAATLSRRWDLAREGALDNLRPSTLQRFLPGQRDLLEVLSVTREDELARMGNCATPLFTLRFRCTSFRLVLPGVRGWADSLEGATVQETFMALSARLDVLRTGLEQARIVYGMTGEEANWLSKFSVHELWALAHDPSMVLVPAVHSSYFLTTLTRDLAPPDRARLSLVTRTVNIPATAY
jgi:hypothetical protein